MPDVPLVWFHLCEPRVIPVARFSSRQLTVGPFMPDADHRGAPVSRRAPRGRFDLAELLAPVRSTFRPEIVLLFSDASRANMPENLAAVPGIKVLVVGDTQHLRTPLQTMLGYADEQGFDWIISPHNRQHLHFFLEAGFPNVAWLPNLECDIEASPASVTKRRRSAVGSGQTGAFHPARRRMVDALARAGVPYEHCRGPRDLVSEVYGQSSVVLNRSLNGDLNLRVSEALGAGACLVTDALSPQSGLDLLLERGRDIALYDDDDQAIDLVRELLADEARADVMAAAGAARFAAELGFARTRARLLRLVMGGAVESPFELTRDLRCDARTLAPDPSTARLALYETCQELNRTRERSVIGLAADVEPSAVLDLIDLHRTTLVLEDGEAAARLRANPRFREVESQVTIAPSAEVWAGRYDVFVGGVSGTVPELAHAPGLLWTGGAARLPAPVAVSASVGATDEEPPTAALDDAEPDADGRRVASMEVTDVLKLANSLDAAGQHQAAEDLCRQTLGQLTAMHEELAVGELERGDADAAARLLRAAVVLAPERLSHRLLLTKALVASSRLDEASVHARRAVDLAPANAVAHDALAAVAYAANLYDEAEQALRDGLELDDTDARRWSNLATVLETQGLAEAAVYALERACEVGATPWLEQRLAAGRRALSAALAGRGAHEQAWSSDRP
jgi:tetratricopeptide (TPR) repeat protein